MENQKESIKTIHWEIDDGYVICEKGTFAYSGDIFIVLIAAFFLMYLVNSTLILVLVLLFLFLKKSDALKRIKSQKGNIIETYRLDDCGVAINNIKTGSSALYPWNELGPFFVDINNKKRDNPFWDLAFGLPPVERIFIFPKQGGDIKLRINKGQSEEIARELSKRLERKKI
ncbi:MAG: hypothetical protein PHI66_04260 [Candidatus Pacebacteria bacterium]|nr:hypothetical protein [Candidatus Paceibacterota bacterium]